MKNDLAYLKYIDDCIERICQYTLEGKEAFFASPMIQDATVRRLQTLAESTRASFPSIKEKSN